MKLVRILACIALLPMAGCVTPGNLQGSSPTPAENKLTVGTVQKEIKQGMTQTQVAEILGSPNIVSSDGPKKETWIYDKVSSETIYSTTSSGVHALVIGAGPALAGGAVGGINKNSGVTRSSQRTITVIIKFDSGKVYDFSYHASSF